ncbi:MAG: EamA family transporter [Solobacterium sp.]|nr:EamA family transporter [Solobacterium sp.]
MDYLLLILGILFEAMGTASLKLIAGPRDITHIVLCLLGYGCGMPLYMRSLKHIGLSITSAFWNGLGITCTTIAAVLIFHEKMTVARVTGITLIICGCIILAFSGQTA